MTIAMGIIISIVNSGLWVLWTMMCVPPSAFSNPTSSIMSIGLLGALSAAVIFNAGWLIGYRVRTRLHQSGSNTGWK